MKRLLMIVAAAMVASSALAAKTWNDETGAVWTYSTSGGGVLIRGYASPEGNVVIPDTIDGLPVVTIYNKAFMDCPWIRSVKIPDSVTSIGTQAFSGCAWLESMTLPSGEFTIGSRAFENCERLSEIKCAGSVKSVGTRAFNGCDLLGDGVIVIVGWVLAVNGACPSEVALPEGTVGIAGGAFRDCKTLRRVTIPANLKSVAASAFDGCSGLKEFIVDPANPYFRAENGMLISKADRRLVCGVNGDVTIPNGIVEIGGEAFDGFANLSSVVIPDSVTKIGEYAFQNCKALTHINIPEGVVTVGANAFEGCDRLDNVDVYSFGVFNGSVKHVYTGVVLLNGKSVGIVQLATAKATSRGVRVGGTIVLDDGKKYSIKSAQAPIENGVLKVETSVSKLGGMTLTIGLNGFKGSVGEGYTVKSADTSSASVLKGTITKTYVDAATGRFKTARVALAGFAINDSAEGDVAESTIWADGVIQEKGKDEMSFSASVR